MNLKEHCTVAVRQKRWNRFFLENGLSHMGVTGRGLQCFLTCFIMRCNSCRPLIAAVGAVLRVFKAALKPEQYARCAEYRLILDLRSAKVAAKSVTNFPC